MTTQYLILVGFYLLAGAAILFQRWHFHLEMRGVAETLKEAGERLAFLEEVLVDVAKGEAIVYIEGGEVRAQRNEPKA